MKSSTADSTDSSSDIPSWGEHNLHQRIKAKQKLLQPDSSTELDGWRSKVFVDLIDMYKNPKYDVEQMLAVLITALAGSPASADEAHKMQSHLKECKTAIESLITKRCNEIIGEDEQEWFTIPEEYGLKKGATDIHRTNVTRNQLRAEQRRRLEGKTDE